MTLKSGRRKEIQSMYHASYPYYSRARGDNKDEAQVADGRKSKRTMAKPLRWCFPMNPRNCGFNVKDHQATGAGSLKTRTTLDLVVGINVKVRPRIGKGG